MVLGISKGRSIWNHKKENEGQKEAVDAGMNLMYLPFDLL